MDQSRPTSEALVQYLNAAGGSERFECWDDKGAPDAGAAERLAHDLRGRLGPNRAAIERSGHRVTVNLIRRRRPAAVA